MNDAGINVVAFATGELPTSTYIIEKGGEALVMDPAESSETIKRIDSLGFLVRAVLNTHGHYDHIGGNGAIKEKYGCDIMISKSDAPMLGDPKKNLSILSVPVQSPDADIVLEEGEYTFFNGLSASIIPLPGHTKGSIAIHFKHDKVLFTGDTLFDGGIGRTDLPGGDLQQLKASLKYLRQMDPELLCYPGHGPSFYLGEQFGFIDMILGEQEI